jgi:formylglycine-generating enzyme required for sulfatase activity
MMMLLLLPALTGAQQAVKCPQSGPLSEAQLAGLVKGSVPAPRIGQFVTTCGIDFEPAEDAIGRLRSAGAPESVLAAVRSATGPAERKRQAEQALWDSIKDSQAAEPFEDYLKRYPNGEFAAAAQTRVATIRAEALRGQVRQALERRQWDTAEGRILDLLRVTWQEDEIRAWQKQIADGRSEDARKVAGMREEIERTLATGQWDAADDKIRDLLRVVSADDEIRGWQLRIADGREKLRLEKEEAARRAGTKKVNPKDGLTYVWISPGTFLMGCSPGDSECSDGEKPAHQVSITKGFWIGQTPVTQQAYQRVTGQSPSHFKGASLPVENVNWEEARTYCVAIGGRLPTEAEWEYAARAGSTSARYGNLDDIAWYLGNSGLKGFTGIKTHEVGQKQPNTLGLYDILGNVWQWVADWYADYPPGAQSDPSGPGSGQQRVLRGGSWINVQGFVRVSYRATAVPDIRCDRFGLRCVGE